MTSSSKKPKFKKLSEGKIRALAIIVMMLVAYIALLVGFKFSH